MENQRLRGGWLAALSLSICAGCVSSESTYDVANSEIDPQAAEEFYENPDVLEDYRSRIIAARLLDPSVCGTFGELGPVAEAACDSRAALIGSIATDPDVRSYFGVLPGPCPGDAGEVSATGYVRHQQALRRGETVEEWNCQFEEALDAADLDVRSVLPMVFTEQASAQVVAQVWIASAEALTNSQLMQSMASGLSDAVDQDPLYADMDLRRRMLENLRQVYLAESEFMDERVALFGEVSATGRDGAEAPREREVSKTEWATAIGVSPERPSAPRPDPPQATGIPWLVMIVIGVVSAYAIYKIVEYGYNAIVFPAATCARHRQFDESLRCALSELPDEVGGDGYSCPGYRASFCEFYNACVADGVAECGVSEFCPGGILDLGLEPDC